MDFNIDQFIDNYFKWLKDNTAGNKIDDNVYEVTTPFLDRHNDSIQIYVKLNQSGVKKGDVILSDGGYTLGDLMTSGIDVSSPKRTKTLDNIMTAHGIKRAPESDELYIQCNMSNCPKRKHDLVQAILETNDMYLTAKGSVISLFLEDVTEFLITSEILFTRSINIVGKSGLTQYFDFIIPGSIHRRIPEKFIKQVNQLTTEKTEALLFSWSETKEVRDDPAKLIVFINDATTKVPNKYVEALKHYDIEPVLWSQRKESLPLLIAS